MKMSWCGMIHFCPWTDCHHNSVKTLNDAAMKLSRSVN